MTNFQNHKPLTIALSKNKSDWNIIFDKVSVVTEYIVDNNILFQQLSFEGRPAKIAASHEGFVVKGR